jgi:hypothetical protein
MGLLCSPATRLGGLRNVRGRCTWLPGLAVGHCDVPLRRCFWLGRKAADVVGLVDVGQLDAGYRVPVQQLVAGKPAATSRSRFVRSGSGMSAAEQRLGAAKGAASARSQVGRLSAASPRRAQGSRIRERRERRGGARTRAGIDRAMQLHAVVTLDS